jgi:hypothetical protein
MERVTKLREQAYVLRTLAASFIQNIRDELLELAAHCDLLAQSMEDNPQAAGLSPSDFPPDLH